MTSDNATLSDIDMRTTGGAVACILMAQSAAADILGRMIRFAEPVAFAALPSPVPGWAIARGPVATTAEAAFLAGAALSRLDNLVRSAPPWAGVWRQRLALKGAAAGVRRLGRREDEAALRDAWHLRPLGADPGPAGRILAAWRQLAERRPDFDEAALTPSPRCWGQPGAPNSGRCQPGSKSVGRRRPLSRRRDPLRGPRGPA